MPANNTWIAYNKPTENNNKSTQKHTQHKEGRTTAVSVWIRFTFLWCTFFRNSACFSFCTISDKWSFLWGPKMQQNYSTFQSEFQGEATEQQEDKGQLYTCWYVHMQIHSYAYNISYHYIPALFQSDLVSLILEYHISLLQRSHGPLKLLRIWAVARVLLLHLI